MPFIDHIRRCNAHDPGRFVSLACGGLAIGSVRLDLVPRLLDLKGAFVLCADGLQIDPDLADADSRTAALHDTLRRLDDARFQTFWEGEEFAIARRFADPPLFRVDRAALPLLGLPAYGVHLNGLVRRADGSLHMWIAVRGADDKQFPGQFDQIVAGGLSHGYGALDTLVKEADEEAGMPEALACTARPVGLISYRMEMFGGLRNDGLFCYDIDLPEDFEPVNRDGEVAAFELWPIERVQATVRDRFDFKFNCPLVVIDFLVRTGRIEPDHEPDYVELMEGLRARQLYDRVGN